MPKIRPALISRGEEHSPGVAKPAYASTGACGTAYGLGRGMLLACCIALLPGVQSRTGNLETRLLESHNQERAALHLPAMKWNDRLAHNAQLWADYLARTGKFEHSPMRRGITVEGENIWGGTAGYYTPESMVGLWIAEKQYFQPGIFPANSKTGHFEDVSHYTQIVWRQTRNVGCGLSKGSTGEILVCRYSRAGNVRGYKPY